jgi:hypothetical protein
MPELKRTHTVPFIEKRVLSKFNPTVVNKLIEKRNL